MNCEVMAELRNDTNLQNRNHNLPASNDLYCYVQFIDISEEKGTLEHIHSQRRLKYLTNATNAECVRRLVLMIMF